MRRCWAFLAIIENQGLRMSFTAIAVYVDFEESAKDRIVIAAELARRFETVLIGVAGWPLRKQAETAYPLTDAPALEERRLEEVSKQLQLIEQRFRQSAGTITARLEWRASCHFPREVIVQEARAVDLVVIGREPLPGDIYRTYDPGTIILAAGRPVLVIPQGIGAFNARRVLIAWKDTREARRAIHDALPMLRDADSVCIAAAQHPERTEGLDRQLGEVAQYLLRHGVTIEKQIATVANEEAGPILLQLAREYRADLIVSGAYGRTRLSEWIFGGVTRHLLMTSAVPCLFSN